MSKYPVTPIEFPYLCTPQKATYALMAGFYIETMPHGTSHDNNKEAERFFKLAADLSGKHFFKTMLENFMKRREGVDK